jgi:hypothetical protein
MGDCFIHFIGGIGGNVSLATERSALSRTSEAFWRVELPRDAAGLGFSRLGGRPAKTEKYELTPIFFRFFCPTPIF